jgi:hypothetical protein
MKAVILALLAVIWAIGCSDIGSELLPVEEDTPPAVLTVQPISGRIGTAISLQGVKFLAGGRYAVAFEGTGAIVLTDSSTATTICTFVPFGAISGRITVFLPGGTIGQTGLFTVAEAVDQHNLSVVAYDIAPPLTPADSSECFCPGGPEWIWHADLNGDTVHISLHFSYGDEMLYEYHLQLIDQGPDHLPRLLNVWTYTIPDHPGARADTLTAGVLKIQNWRTDGIMSGRFFGTPMVNIPFNGTMKFWVNPGG